MAAKKETGKKKGKKTVNKVTEETTEEKTTGRPPLFTPELALDFCTRVATYEFPHNSVRNICKAEDMPSKTTIFHWMAKAKDPKQPEEYRTFMTQYELAQDVRIHNMFEEMFDIAYDSSNDRMIGKDGYLVKNSEFTTRSRLKVDVIKFALSKLRPQTYGDKLNLEHTGDSTAGNTKMADIITMRNAAKERLEELKKQVVDDEAA